MGEFAREYLSLLSEKYPNEASVCSEIINLEAILTLPKGTEHFISDLHGEYDAVREDIRAVKEAVGEKILKVIIETCLLTEAEKLRMCDIVCEAGADYIKTSTGFSTGGGTPL